MSQDRTRDSGRHPAPTAAVEVWIAHLPDTLTACRTLLSPDERERERRFRQPADAARYVVGRALMRLVLAERLMADPTDLRIDTTCVYCRGPHGKPRVRQPLPPVVDASLTHCGNVVLLAVSDGADVGVDVEHLRPSAFDDAAHLFLSKTELDEIGKLESGERTEALLTCWVRKEAYLKAIALGLAADMRSFAVSFLPGDRPRLRTALGGDDPACWSVRPLEIRTGTVAAVAVRAPAVEVRTVEVPGALLAHARLPSAAA